MGMPVIIPGSITKAAAVGDIIESVAMEEAALAHILNAESEKLLAALDNASVTPGELLAVNCSVREIIGAITGLEMLLKAKLELYQGTICQ